MKSGRDKDNETAKYSLIKLNAFCSDKMQITFVSEFQCFLVEFEKEKPNTNQIISRGNKCLIEEARAITYNKMRKKKRHMGGHLVE